MTRTDTPTRQSLFGEAAWYIVFYPIGVVLLILFIIYNLAFGHGETPNEEMDESEMQEVPNLPFNYQVLTARREVREQAARHLLDLQAQHQAALSPQIPRYHGKRTEKKKVRFASPAADGPEMAMASESGEILGEKHTERGYGSFEASTSTKA